ncbi:putative blumeria specific protein [Erysiphe necator]|uniref:Putative blumeria specific protein n=1 Tax=Uncinula necator TaxID=52586 RepID=A0A0B1P150_UNCNE|nr:putative blumeria specific protein [Erysiphe necator]
MLHHYPQVPPIAQPVISIPHSLYTQSPHSQPQPQLQPQPIPPTVTVSFLPPATSLYANLLQPLSIKIIQSFAHTPLLHQYQLPTSTFGLTHLYPPHPLFLLTQSSPHVPLRPVHIFLPAPSQHALREFCTQSEVLLPCGGGRIELIEFGERCCVTDLDGNIIEVHWSSHHTARTNGYLIPDAPSQLSHPQRCKVKSLAYSSYRERDKSREKRKENEVRIYGEDRRIRQSSKNEPIVSENMTLEAESKPNTKNRRVLQWQKDVAKSINYEDVDSEDLDNSNEFVSSEDDEHPLADARSYTRSQSNYRARSGRNKAHSPYHDTYETSDNYRTRKDYRENYKYQKSSKRRNGSRKRREVNFIEDHDDSFTPKSKYGHDTAAVNVRSKNNDYLITKTPANKNNAISRRADMYSESSSSPSKYTYNRYFVPKKSSDLSANYISRRASTRPSESKHIMPNNSDRRDSGIGGICDYSGGELERGEFEKHPRHKYRSSRSITSKTPGDTRPRYLPRTSPKSHNHNDEYKKTEDRTGKRLHRKSRTSFKHQSCSSTSSDKFDDESYDTISSKSEFFSKHESSSVAKGREEEKRRRWIEERDQVRDLHRKQLGRELAGKNRQKSSRKSNRHHSSVRSAAPHSPSSVSGSAKRDNQQILARVPKPPSAVPPLTREKSKRFEKRHRDDYDDNSDDFSDSDSGYDLPITERKSHRRTSYLNPSPRHHSSRRQSGGDFNYSSGGKRELLSRHNPSRHEYATSDAISEGFTSESDQPRFGRRRSSIRRY